MTSAQHSSKSAEWGTPTAVIEAVREFYSGNIDLDAASNEKWNETVKAGLFYSAKNSALINPWFGNVYVNPPDGKVGNKSLSGLFWERMLTQRCLFRHCVFTCFNIEQMAVTQQYENCIQDFTFCVTNKRLRFVEESGKNLASPPHSSVIVYIRGDEGVPDDHRFISIFSQFGKVTLRR